MRLKDNKVYESGGANGGGNDKRFTYTMAAVFCAAVVMLLAVFTVRANPQWLARNDSNRINLTDNPPKENHLDIFTPETDVVQPVPTVDSLDYEPEVESQNESSSGSATAFSLPVEGNIMTQHTESVYSKTLEHYSAHTGVDIEAPLDTPVLAAAAGTVIAVYNDDRLGLSIEINHGNGLITKYSNLSTDKLVGESDVVEKGQPISGIGSTALFESMEIPHLHFEVFKDGESVDPLEFF